MEVEPLFIYDFLDLTGTTPEPQSACCLKKTKSRWISAGAAAGWRNKTTETSTADRQNNSTFAKVAKVS